jgi:hypothetical protein
VKPQVAVEPPALIGLGDSGVEVVERHITQAHHADQQAEVLTKFE